MGKNEFYFQVIFFWLLVTILSLYITARVLIDALNKSSNLFFVALLLTLIIHVFLLNLIKDTGYLYLWNRFKHPLRRKKTGRKKPLVELLYYTGSGFNYTVLEKSLQQNYPNYRVVILDNSTKKNARRRIAYFAKKHAITVVRRGTKASKTQVINDYLKTSNTPFFVLLDNRGYIPADFIAKALPYFSVKKVAVVQANHKVIENSHVAKEFYTNGSLGHSNIYSSMKDSFGFLPASGHGIMVRKDAFVKTSGFVYLENEDLLFSLELRKKRYTVRFAEDVYYFEGSRSNRCSWTGVNALFLLYKGKSILYGKMKWYEKLDLFLFLHRLPLKAVLAAYYLLYLSVHVLLSKYLGYTLRMEMTYLLLLSVPLLVYGQAMYVTHEREINKTAKFVAKTAFKVSLLSFQEAKEVAVFIASLRLVVKIRI